MKREHQTTYNTNNIKSTKEKLRRIPLEFIGCGKNIQITILLYLLKSPNPGGLRISVRFQFIPVYSSTFQCIPVTCRT